MNQADRFAEKIVEFSKQKLIKWDEVGKADRDLIRTEFPNSALTEISGFRAVSENSVLMITNETNEISSGNDNFYLYVFDEKNKMVLYYFKNNFSDEKVLKRIYQIASRGGKDEAEIIDEILSGFLKDQ